MIEQGPVLCETIKLVREAFRADGDDLASAQQGGKCFAALPRTQVVDAEERIRRPVPKEPDCADPALYPPA